MGKMKKKIICMIICLIIFSLNVPLAMGIHEKSDAENVNVGRVWLRGLCFNIVDLGNKNFGWAIKVHYIEFTPTERTTGVLRLKRITFGDSILTGRMYEPGPFGLFTYVFGLFRGGMEVQ